MTMGDRFIIGWGPVGKALAIGLLQQGHRVAVVERWPQDCALPRAVAFDHEIGRLFQTLGLAAEAERMSCVPGSYEWRNAGGEVLQRFDWVGMGLSGWPAMSTFCQPELEAAMDARARQLPGLSLHRGWEAVELDVLEGIVQMRAARRPATAGSDVLTLQARCVVGCDGAKSFVRAAMDSQMLESFKLLGLPAWFGTFIGACEVAGAVGLFITPLRSPAAGGVAVIMIGALYFHITHPPTAAGVPALIFLLLASWIATRGKAGLVVA